MIIRMMLLLGALLFAMPDVAAAGGKGHGHGHGHSDVGGKPGKGKGHGFGHDKPGKPDRPGGGCEPEPNPKPDPKPEPKPEPEPEPKPEPEEPSKPTGGKDGKTVTSVYSPYQTDVWDPDKLRRGACYGGLRCTAPKGVSMRRAALQRACDKAAERRYRVLLREPKTKTCN